MRAILILLVVTNLALALLLVALSGFILQGVNNTGPMMPEAVFYIALIVAAIIAPLTALLLRKRVSQGTAIAIAAAPLACAAAALLIGPS